ncbi:MAG: DUF3035 domain-containing protein [Niveispirillum sp.]|uniref:DUF3035 domain-containing protein n=1 Tax=Niveispirillum sp. TaxID=1917217 RepID=UPI003BA4B658
MVVLKQVRKAAVPAITVLAMGGLLSGCGLFGGHDAPDEFMVVARAPLEVPPDFSLRPPQPGSPRPQEMERDTRSQASVFGASTAGSGALVDPRTSPKQTNGEGALLAQAGADGANPEIRAIVDRENPGVVVGSPTFLDKLMFWKDEQNPEVMPPPGGALSTTRETGK